MTKILAKPNKITESTKSLTDHLEFERVVTSLDNAINEPPAHLPDKIDTVMREGNKCLSAQCWNAAGSMYRLALDLATKSLLPDDETPSTKIRRSLGLRLQWLFDNELLPKELRELAECVQQDGNDGAHDGSLNEIDATDLHDFSFELLRRLFTEPERIAVANRRRVERRRL